LNETIRAMRDAVTVITCIPWALGTPSRPRRLAVEQVGEAIVDLVIDPGHDRDAYLLTAAGLSPVEITSR
jgi:hypothetical protein